MVKLHKLTMVVHLETKMDNHKKIIEALILTFSLTILLGYFRWNCDYV